jgi:hypothetical protein
MPDCGVEGCVAFSAGDRVAFESFLVEEHVYDFICSVSVELLFLTYSKRYFDEQLDVEI